MYIAAAIMSYGGVNIKVDASNPNQQRFMFRDNNLLRIVVSDSDIILKTLDNVPIEDAVMYFTSARLWFPPSYAQCLRNIKSAIHTNKRR